MNGHRFLIPLFCITIAIVCADDSFRFPEDDEKRSISPEQVNERTSVTEERAEGRFLPFSASFTLNAGTPSNAHSLSLGAGQDGISLSQSSSHSHSSGNAGSLSASQSSSFSAGLSGISASDANSFNLNHPLFGSNSQAHSNSFSLGQTSSAANANVQNNGATSNAQSSVGSTHSLAASGTSASSSFGNSHRPVRPSWSNFGPSLEIHDRPTKNQRPSLTVIENPNLNWPYREPERVPTIEFEFGKEERKPELVISPWQSNNRRPNQGGIWYTDDCQPRPGRRCRNNRESTDAIVFPGIPSSRPTENWYPQTQWSENQTPDLQVNAASASASSSSSGTNGLSISQSSSQSNSDSRRPTSFTVNNVHTVGNAQGYAQGAATSIGTGQKHKKTDGSFSSGSISGISMGHGESIGLSVSQNQGGNSVAHVIAQGMGTANALGGANSGGVALVNGFPRKDGRTQNIPQDFIRIDGKKEEGRRNKHPLGEFISDIEDTVVDLLGFS